MIWLIQKLWPVAVFANLLINEVSYKGTPEWVEIYNDSDQTFELSGLILKDANNTSKDDLILDGSILSHEYKVFENTKSWLNDTGDTIFLISSSSGTLIDQVIFDKAVDQKSYSRIGTSFEYMDPTKGFANAQPTVILPTSTTTQPPTQQPTASKTPTQTPTIAPTQNSKSISTSPTKNYVSATPEASIITPSITSITGPETILGETTASSASEILELPENEENQIYGYLLMFLGCIICVIGAGLGYLRYRENSVK